MKSIKDAVLYQRPFWIAQIRKTLVLVAACGILVAASGCPIEITDEPTFPRPCEPVRTSPRSDFDNSDEGWRVIGSVFAEPTPPVFNSTLQAISATGDGGWVWRAPAKFSGCLSRAYGNNLSFRLGLTEDGWCGFNDHYVRIQGRQVAVVFNLPSVPSMTGTLYTVRLDESEQWFNESTGLRATRAEIRGILADLRRLEIAPGEFRICPGGSTLDDVLLEVTP